ncbi:MAG TPA: hypothetical protein VKX28_30825 [Xanthobacteraceae bacterium]|nr:hypothetical protein [Xanthobacteraceae bacterium]
MSEILDDRPEVLVVRLGATFPHSSTCVFDKGRGRARFERRLFFIPRRAIEVAFADVVSFEVIEMPPPVDSFDLRVVLASGKRFYLSPAATREETRDIAREVRAFLGLSQEPPP